MIRLCPKCGSANIYNHDSGFPYYFRLILNKSRLVCRECKTTWRRDAPNQFAKLKYRKRLQTIIGAEYVKKNWDEAKTLSTQQQITELVSKWQFEGSVYVYFDFKGITGLTLIERTCIVKISRKLKSVAGDLVLINANQTIYDELLSLNLGYLIAGNHKIKSE